MPLAPEAINSVSRLVGDVDVLDSDETFLYQRRGAIGTCFCVSVPGKEMAHGYLVTADHVLHDQADVQVQFPDASTEGTLHAPIAARDWRRPLDDVDLALCPLRSLDFGAADRQIELSDLKFHNWTDEVPLGTRVHYVGLLEPLDRPMLRSGNVGAINQNGIEHVDGYVYTAHLVDCRSYEGFSGSPFFRELIYAYLEPAEFPAGFEPPDGLKLAMTRSMYRPCGMLTEHVHENVADRTASSFGVATMLRWQEIRTALMSEAFVDERREWDAG